MLAISPETEALILVKATAAGKTPDQYLHDLVASGTPTRLASKPDLARLKAIAAQVAALPLLDTRTEKEITDEGWDL